MTIEIPVARLLLLAALAWPGVAVAQHPSLPPDTIRTEPDQELDDFSGQFNKLHLLSARLRGVRAAHGTVYWVSADNQRLAAYQAGRLLWKTNVVASFRVELPTAHITSLVLASNTLFVNLSPRGMAEVDRKTGCITGRYFDRDPHKLVAEPK